MIFFVFLLYLYCIKQKPKTMVNDLDAVKLIFGLKVQQLRRDQRLSYQQLSDKTGIAISYLHNIEKGKKYPKADKIMILAKALNTSYNDMVSLSADKRLQPIIDLLQSNFLKLFPLELFGISLQKLVELLADTPDKVNAFISTVIKIMRNYNLRGEDFYRAALRSYQDLNDNYFEDIEKAVSNFCDKQGLKNRNGFQPVELERLLKEQFGIIVNREVLPQQPELKEIRSFFVPQQRVLFLSDDLDAAQENFLLAKEIGFQVLELQDRPYETRMLDAESFDKLLNNFKASYFSVALLMQEDAMIEEVERIAQWDRWEPTLFFNLLSKYQVSQEMLIQRLANILPRHFDIKDLFFLRFYTGPDLKKFEMTKEMHLSQLHDPHANQMDEHYCRRWVSISLIRRMKTENSISGVASPMVDAQISRYWGTPNAYFCICMAKPGRHDENYSISVTIGLLVNEKLKRLFRFLDQVKVKDVHTTCERCSISDCGARAVPPIVLQLNHSRAAIRKQLNVLNQQITI